MSDLTNKIVLFLYCLLAAARHTPDAVFVLVCLSAVTISASSSYFARPRYTAAAAALYGAACFFFPAGIAFVPLLAYDLFPKPCRIFLLPAFAAAFYAFSASAGDVFPALHLVCGTFIALLLYRWAQRFAALDARYHSLQDDSTEQTLLLADTNRRLLEKQDEEIYTATLQERNRIAREIHDNVGHMLSRAILMTGALKAVAREETLTTPLDNLDSTLNLAMTSIRRSVHDLHDESVNLKEAIQTLLDDFTFCETDFHFQMSYALPRELKYCFIAIVKEALVNTSRHSNATVIHLSLLEHPGFWQLDIRDNGNTPGGIDATGIGLSNIRERILALGGQVEFQKSPGFRIFATIPKPLSTHEQEP